MKDFEIFLYFKGYKIKTWIKSKTRLCMLNGIFGSTTLSLNFWICPDCTFWIIETIPQVILERNLFKKNSSWNTETFAKIPNLEYILWSFFRFLFSFSHTRKFFYAKCLYILIFHLRDFLKFRYFQKKSQEVLIPMLLATEYWYFAKV